MLSPLINNPIARRGAYSFLIQGLGALLVLLNETLLAKILSLSDFGIYSLIATWLSMFVLLGTFGSNYVLLRFVPAYIASANFSSLKGIVKSADKFVLFSAGAIFFVFWLYVRVGNHILINYKLTLFIALLTLPFLMFSALRQATLRGSGEVFYAFFPELIFKPLLFALLLVVYSLERHISINVIFICLLITSSLSFFLSSKWQNNRLSKYIVNIDANYHFKEWWQVAKSIFMIVTVTTINTKIGIIVIGMFPSYFQSTDLGIYAAASRLSDTVAFGLFAITSVITPIIARLHSLNKTTELQALLNVSTFLISIVALVITGVTVIFGKAELSLFGDAYLVGYNILIVLCLGQFVNSLSGPVGNILIMTGHHNNALKIVSISLIFNLLMCVFLIPTLKLIGVAIASSASLALWNILMVFYVKRQMLLECSFVSSLTSLKNILRDKKSWEIGFK